MDYKIRRLSLWAGAFLWGAAALLAREASGPAAVRLVEVRPDRSELVVETQDGRTPLRLADIVWGVPAAPTDRSFASAVTAHTVQFLGEHLDHPFHVQWEAKTGALPAAGRITLADGRDLAELLVSEGLAQRSRNAENEALAGLEREAMLKGRGLWMPEGRRKWYIILHQPGARQELAGDFVPVSDTAGLVARAGRLTTVRGTISRVGSSPSGHLTFLNFRGVERGGFSVIVRRETLPKMEAAMPGFPQDLVGSEVEISGVISLHRDAPQIELRSPEQLRKR